VLGRCGVSREPVSEPGSDPLGGDAHVQEVEEPEPTRKGPG
jgi:hypothetical protein